MLVILVILQREVSGVVTASTEFLVNHEFNIPATRSAEMLMQEIMKYINEHGNPITLCTDRDSDAPETLHNILTQGIMSKEIRKNLLEFYSGSQSLTTRGGRASCSLWYGPVANVCDLLLFLDENRFFPEFRHF